MPYFAYIVGGWVQKEDKFCLCNKSMAPNLETIFLFSLNNFQTKMHKIAQKRELR